MSDQLKSILFATATAVVCSLLISGASVGLSGLKKRNIALDRQKNILLAAGLVQKNKHHSSEDLEKIFSENIKSYRIDTAGRIIHEQGKVDPTQLPISLYIKNDKIAAYIIPIDTQGLWGKIHGYLALEKDGTTIIGFTVYKHSETPGLGGEIEKEWFTKNFTGKKIVDKSGNFVSIAIAGGKVSSKISEKDRPNYVDAISGATLTGKFLTTGFKKILTGYEPVSIKFRKNMVRLPQGG